MESTKEGVDYNDECIKKYGIVKVFKPQVS
jgi:hypothetical protein